MDLLDNAMTEVMGALYGCGSTSFEVNESGARKWGFPRVTVWNCRDISEERTC